MNSPFLADNSIEDILVKIKSAQQNKNIGKVHQVVLRNGPRAFRTASLFQILDEAQKHHHYTLTIHCINKSKAGWTFDNKRYVTIPDESEVKALLYFLSHSLTNEPAPDGTYRLVDHATVSSMQSLIEASKDATSSEKIELIRLLIEGLSTNDVTTEQLQSFVEKGSSEIVRAIGVSAKLIEYRTVVSKLERMINENTAGEKEYQQVLQTHPWMFGSEYSSLLERRKWTRDDELDYMLRRTADNYLEIVEIKTPIDQALFNRDKSHNSHYPAAPLATVFGQVVRYLEEVERFRDSIIASDNEDPLKIRARIIIGRDRDEDQTRALRNFNAHLHRIEVLTFDQLLRIGRRVLAVFETDDELPATGGTSEWDIDDIPF